MIYGLHLRPTKLYFDKAANYFFFEMLLLNIHTCTLFDTHVVGACVKWTSLVLEILETHQPVSDLGQAC